MNKSEMLLTDFKKLVNGKGKRGKYKNKKVIVDGLKFDSMKEAERYLFLKSELNAGKITLLERQTSHLIVVNGIKVCKYLSDFSYVKNGLQIVEDVKSEFTKKLPVYRLKKILMKAVLGIEIVEV